MATQRVFVGNLPFTSKSGDVRELFAPYGEVLTCTLIVDSGSRPGYGFVDMEAEHAAKDAVLASLGVSQMPDRAGVADARKQVTDVVRFFNAKDMEKLYVQEDQAGP